MMNDEVFAKDCYPVLVGVSQNVALPVTTSQHPDSTDATRDTSSPSNGSPAADESASQYINVRPLAISAPRQPVSRQKHCYHSTVSRQWMIDAYETCDSCGRRPLLRWFYLCTEDTSSHSDSVDLDGSFLSSWITEAILAGEYTDAQREILIEQKLGVLRMCERERAESTHLISIDGAQSNPSEDLEHQYGHDSQTHQTDRPDMGARSNLSTTKIHTHPARCSYRACYHCDRKLQERTWLSLNAVCNDPHNKTPSAWDLWRTPVSDVQLVRNLGLRYSSPPPPPPHLLPYVYRSAESRHIRRGSGNYLVGHESSVSLHALMNNLSTIEEFEELSEETEFRKSDASIEISHCEDIESLVDEIGSELLISIDLDTTKRDENDSDGSRYS